MHLNHRVTGSRDRSVVRVLDLQLKGRGFESLQEWQENFLLQDQLFVLTYFVSRKKPGHSAKTTGGRLQLNTQRLHFTDVALHEVT